MEGSHSGLVHHLGKVAYLNGYREFESLPLRHKSKSHFEADLSEDLRFLRSYRKWLFHRICGHDVEAAQNSLRRKIGQDEFRAGISGQYHNCFLRLAFRHHLA